MLASSFVHMYIGGGKEPNGAMDHAAIPQNKTNSKDAT